MSAVICGHWALKKKYEIRKDGHIKCTCEHWALKRRRNWNRWVQQKRSDISGKCTEKDEIIIGCIHCISLIQEEWALRTEWKIFLTEKLIKTVYFYTIDLTNPNKGRFWRKQSQTKVVQKWPSNLLDIWLNKSICLAFLCIIASTALAWQTFPTKL